MEATQLEIDFAEASHHDDSDRTTLSNPIAEPLTLEDKILLADLVAEMHTKREAEHKHELMGIPDISDRIRYSNKR